MLQQTGQEPEGRRNGKRFPIGDRVRDTGKYPASDPTTAIEHLNLLVMYLTKDCGLKRPKGRAGYVGAICMEEEVRGCAERIGGNTTLFAIAREARVIIHTDEKIGCHEEHIWWVMAPSVAKAFLTPTLVTDIIKELRQKANIRDEALRKAKFEEVRSFRLTAALELLTEYGEKLRKIKRISGVLSDGEYHPMDELRIRHDAALVEAGLKSRPRKKKKR